MQGPTHSPQRRGVTQSCAESRQMGDVLRGCRRNDRARVDPQKAPHQGASRCPGWWPEQAAQRRGGAFWGSTLWAGVPKGPGPRCAACPGHQPGTRAAPCPEPLATPARARSFRPHPLSEPLRSLRLAFAVKRLVLVRCSPHPRPLPHAGEGGGEGGGSTGAVRFSAMGRAQLARQALDCRAGERPAPQAQTEPCQRRFSALR